MLADRAGVAAAEFALVASIILVLLLGVFDLGLWVWESMALEGAVIAGGHYAQQFPGDSTGIHDAIVAALPPSLADATIATPAMTRDCGDGGGPVPDSGVCSPGSPRTFVTLSVSYPFSPLYLTTLTRASVQYVIRVQ